MQAQILKTLPRDRFHLTLRLYMHTRFLHLRSHCFFMPDYSPFTMLILATHLFRGNGLAVSLVMVSPASRKFLHLSVHPHRSLT